APEPAPGSPSAAPPGAIRSANPRRSLRTTTRRPPPASCWEIRAARNTVSCEMFEPCRQLLGAAAVAQEHRALRGQAPDARDGKAAGQPNRVLQARAHSGRCRKQELVVFSSTKRVEQRRSFLDRQCV